VTDLLALALSGLWVILIVATAEGLRKTNRISFAVSRKWIHIGVGTWIIPTTLLFRSPWWAVLGPLAFIGLNLLSRKRRLIRSMEEEAGENVGAVLFPLSFALLILGLWPREGGRCAAAAGILCLAWGDAAAALIGRRFGRHRYAVGTGWRSYEGSTAMFLVSLVAICLACVATGNRIYPWPTVLLGALASTLLEAVGRRGFDNLWVPVGTALTLFALGTRFA